MADEEFLPSDPMLLAGEYALRVLEGDELVAAQRLVLADPEFADAVQWWESWLACMAEEAPPITPSPRVWQAIDSHLEGRAATLTQLASLADQTPTRTGPSGWSVALAGTGIAAMIAAAFIAMPGTSEPRSPNDPVAAQPAEQLIAQLASEDGGTTLAGRIDPVSGRLALTTAGFPEAERQAPELWVIPAGGAPVSLGLIPTEGRFDRDLSDSERALLISGATLAVTMENRDTAPHDAPTSAALIAGALDLI